MPEDKLKKFKSTVKKMGKDAPGSAKKLAKTLTKGEALTKAPLPKGQSVSKGAASKVGGAHFKFGSGSLIGIRKPIGRLLN